MPLGNKLHEQELAKYTKELENQGYRVIKLNGKSPDAIAVKLDENNNLEIAAVEALSSQWKKGKGWKKQWTVKAKQANYSMFDKVLIHAFRRPKHTPIIPSYCDFKHCRETEISQIEVQDHVVYLCPLHMRKLEAVDPQSKTEMVYWCRDYLNKREKLTTRR